MASFDHGGILDISHTVSKLYTTLSTLKQQSQHIQKADIEQLLRSALTSAPDSKNPSTSVNRSSCLQSNDSNDSGRIQISLKCGPSDDDEEIPLVYCKSMVRQFPAKDRTPEEMEQRRRYRDAGRIGRAKSKLAEIMMEKEAIEQSSKNASIKQMIASQLAYANELCKLLGLPKVTVAQFE